MKVAFYPPQTSSQRQSGGPSEPSIVLQSQGLILPCVTATGVTVPRIHLNLEIVAELGKILMFFGVALAAVGLLLFFLGKTPLPLGRLPGDILYRGKNTTFYFPLMTSLVLSVVLSILFYVVGHFPHDGSLAVKL